ncbi:MAG: DUF4235 domain-containing protein [Bifidobacteriaceae bacterium]|jgi:hypothetical protein|nr:DUF4235 domain-containing protein [Bifidobacteriaceae bacterium]
MKLTKHLYVTLAAMAAGFVASSLVKVVWRLVAGEKAPEDADDLTASTVQVTVFAAALAAATAIAQTLASRKSLEAWQRREVEDVEALG